MKLKRLHSIMKKRPAHWVGDGFPVRSMISPQDEPEVNSPFLLLDYAEPYEFEPSEQPRGVGEHPHRGFETVTIAYQGEIDHRDSAGNKGSIGPGDVQWMTAASGVVHEELHGADFTHSGGTFEMIQLWVNLPAEEKARSPRYQELNRDVIPVVVLPDDAGTLRVIAGEAFGAKGPAKTVTPIQLLDLDLSGNVELPLPEGTTTLLLVRSGSIQINGTDSAGEGEFVRFERTGNGIALDAQEKASVVVLNGTPIDEPVAAQGPFVMNTREELLQAFQDYQSGAMGRLAP
jgi:hypothetical protein